MSDMLLFYYKNWMSSAGVIACPKLCVGGAGDGLLVDTLELVDVTIKSEIKLV